MIKLKNKQIPKKTKDKLKSWQTEITGTYKEQYGIVDVLWKKYSAQAGFRPIKDVLTAMCSGAQRCVFCEDSAGNQIEHFAPKRLFPNLTFVWSNYLYACSGCNGPKQTKFAVFRKDNGTFEYLKKSDIQPPKEKPVLLNPRIDNPMQFLFLSLITFKFDIIPTVGKDRERANYTLNEVIKLNERNEVLINARREAFGNYTARLKEYLLEKNNKAGTKRLSFLKKGIQEMQHPTVFKEMQRQWDTPLHHDNYKEIKAIFKELPEALKW